MIQKRKSPVSVCGGTGETPQLEKSNNLNTKLVNPDEISNTAEVENKEQTLQTEDIPSLGNKLFQPETNENKREVIIPPKTNLNKLDKDGLPEFPIYGLPSLIQKLTKQGAEVYQVPQELFAVSFISAMCAAVKKKAKLFDRYSNYPQLWILIIGRSGVGKSQPLSVAFEPLENRECEKYALYQNGLLKWREDSKNASNGGGDSNQSVFKHSLNSDATPEALLKEIAESDGITILRDELIGWFKDFGRYGNSGEVETYLSIYNNKTIVITRKREGYMLIEKPYLSIIGTTQPDAIKQFLKNRMMVDNGFIQRFLFVFPSDFPKAYYTEKVMDRRLLAEYNVFIHDLCEMPDLEVSFSEETKRRFAKYSDELTDKVNQTDNGFLRAVYSKMEITLSRLSLIVHVAKIIAKETCADVIEVSTIEYCIQVCRYFVATAEKVNNNLLGYSEGSMLSNRDLMKELSRRYKLNQSKLAEGLGVTQQAINKLLR